jgi:hypothetical protein
MSDVSNDARERRPVLERPPATGLDRSGTQATSCMCPDKINRYDRCVRPHPVEAKRARRYPSIAMDDEYQVPGAVEGRRKPGLVFFPGDRSPAHCVRDDPGVISPFEQPVDIRGAGWPQEENLRFGIIQFRFHCRSSAVRIDWFSRNMLIAKILRDSCAQRDLIGGPDKITDPVGVSLPPAAPSDRSGQLVVNDRIYYHLHVFRYRSSALLDESAICQKRRTCSISATTRWAPRPSMSA